LRIIAKALPDQYELQNIAARVAVENNLNAQQTRAVVEKLRTAPTIAEATAMAEETDWKAVDPVYSESRTRELRNKNATTGGADNAGSSASETSAQDAATGISQFDMLGNVCQELLVTEATLGRTALSNLILEGDYVPPVTPDRTRLFDITPDNHEQLAKLVQPGNSFGKLDMFYDTTEKITEALMRRVTQSTKVTEDAARLALRLAVMRVATDLEQGDLRLAEITRPGIFSGLLYGCTLDEIKRSRPAAALSTAMPDEAGLDGPEHSFRRTALSRHSRKVPKRRLRYWIRPPTTDGWITATSRNTPVLNILPPGSRKKTSCRCLPIKTTSGQCSRTPTGRLR
jgi:hypothetical protein